jgi:hypothetical protein
MLDIHGLISLMGEQEIIFDASEMRVLRIGCMKCGTKILFDCANEQTAVPDHCPSCKQDFGEVTGWITGYRKWYNVACKSKTFTFQFQVANK